MCRIEFRIRDDEASLQKKHSALQTRVIRNASDESLNGTSISQQFGKQKKKHALVTI